MKRIDIYDDLKEVRVALVNSKDGLSKSGRGFALSFTDRVLIEHLIEQIDIELDTTIRRCMNCGQRVEWNNRDVLGSLGWIHVYSRANLCYSVNPVATPYPLEENI